MKIISIFSILIAIICLIGTIYQIQAEETGSKLMKTSPSGTHIPFKDSVFSLSNIVPPIKYSMAINFQKFLTESKAVIIPVPISFGPFGVNRVEIIVPNHWRKGIRVGTFYDQVLGITWIYDRNLQTCFSPEKGWVLVTEYSTERIPLAQYYFDLDNRILFDMYTGLPLTGGPPLSTPQSAETPMQVATEPEISICQLRVQLEHFPRPINVLLNALPVLRDFVMIVMAMVFVTKTKK